MRLWRRWHWLLLSGPQLDRETRTTAMRRSNSKVEYLVTRHTASDWNMIKNNFSLWRMNWKNWRCLTDRLVCGGDSGAIILLGPNSEKLSLSIWSTYSQLLSMWRLLCNHSCQHSSPSVNAVNSEVDWKPALTETLMWWRCHVSLISNSH